VAAGLLDFFGEFDFHFFVGVVTQALVRRDLQQNERHAAEGGFVHNQVRDEAGVADRGQDGYLVQVRLGVLQHVVAQVVYLLELFAVVQEFEVVQADHLVQNVVRLLQVQLLFDLLVFHLFLDFSHFELGQVDSLLGVQQHDVVFVEFGGVLQQNLVARVGEVGSQVDNGQVVAVHELLPLPRNEFLLLRG